MASRTLALPLALLLLLGLAVTPAEGRGPPLFPVPHHFLQARLDLAGHRLVATDTISFLSMAPSPLRIRLNPDLKISAIASHNHAGPFQPGTATAVEGQPGVYELSVVKGATDVEIHYSGVIYDQVQKSEDLSWVVGDNTRGVIDENGVYLSPASEWIPRVVGQRMAAFDITTFVPSPYQTITQGSVPNRSKAFENPGFEKTDTVRPSGIGREKQRGERTYNMAQSQAVIPTDGVYLTAGKYVSKSKTVRGVTVSTWFFETEAEAMDLWLNEAAATVERYAPILGDYPHPKFDIVSNFFQSGYGMPGWTLLGDRVIRYVTAKAQRSGNKIPPGYLDHEYVHGWFGNGLFVDYRDGNWCESITTYYANYLAKELVSKEQAREHRRGVLEKFSLRVKGEGDYALRKFVTKTEDKDNDIGYGKGSMLFHMIRRHVGDKVFFDTVTSFTQANVGKVVRWEDWFAAFSKASDQDITAHLGPFLERPSLPSVRIETCNAVPAKDGRWSLDLKVVSTPSNGAAWPLDVPVRITLKDGTVMDEVASLSGAPFERMWSRLTSKPARVELDPDFDILRRIPDADLPQCLNRTLEASGGTVYVVTPLPAFQSLAKRMAATKGFTVKEGPAEINGPTIILQVHSGEGGVDAAGKTWSDPSVAIMSSRAVDGHPVTTYTAMSPAAAARAGYATYYGWDSTVVFRGGRPVERKIERGVQLATQRKLAALDPTPLERDLMRLCSAEFEGRRPGTPGHTKCAAWLKERLDAELDQTFTMSVPLPKTRRLSSRMLRIKTAKGTVALENAFRPFAFTVEDTEDYVIPAAAGKDGLRILEFDGEDPVALATLLSKHKAEGRVLGVVLGDKAKVALAPWLDMADDLTPQAVTELAKPLRDGSARPRPPIHAWISGRRARGGFPEELEVNAIQLEAFAAKRIREARADGATLEFEVELEGPTAFGLGEMVLGVLAAHVPDEEEQDVVLVTAHYDALGKTPEGFFPGADDNASGVAGVLEAIRGLKAEWNPDGHRTTIVVCFTDCEEWGLLGARQLAHSWTGREGLRLRAVINVDSIGRAISKPTYVLGVSKHPALAAVVQSALTAEGCKPGRDIDKYAYAHGSDHWPFHEAGFPAIGIWASDYAIMNTQNDTLEHVETAGIAKIARALRRILLNVARLP